MSERTMFEAPVRAVTVLEDRAVVVRIGRANLPAGKARLQIDGLAPVVVDKTIGATATGAEVRDVRVRRKWLSKEADREGEHAEIVRSLRVLDEQIATTAATMKRRSDELSYTVQARQLLVREIGDDVAWARAGRAGWAEGWRAALARDVAIRLEIADLKKALAALKKTRRDLALREAATRSPSSYRAAWLEVDLDVGEASDVEVRLEYIVPGACWRPQHRATLIGDSVRIETDACVWQRTGEDWTDAKLSLSTERPSLGVEPPTLSSDVLRTKKKAEVVEVETREQTVETVGLGRDHTVAPELPGVDDGGEARLLVAPGSATVLSDGRPYRVHLSSYETTAERNVILVPECSPLAVVRTRQTHESDVPLLAGPVDLVADSGPVGRTTTLFVAPGERFELGWGPEPTVRVHRETKTLDEKSKMLSSWIRVPHRVKLKLSNLATTDVEIEVTERVPVSEVPQVEIELDAEKTTEGQSPDEDGFVRWTVRLRGKSREELRLAYTLAKKSDVRGI